MASPIVEILDTVAVVRDLPDLGLSAGEVGAVVDVLADGVYEVEFCDDGGYTYGMHALRDDQFVVLHRRGEAFRGRPNAG